MPILQKRVHSKNGFEKTRGDPRKSDDECAKVDPDKLEGIPARHILRSLL